MSYNPARLKKTTKRANNRPAIPKNHGRKHSTIMKQRGVGVTSPEGKRENTKHGWQIPILSGKKFVQRYECMHPANKTSFGVNWKADKTVYVIQGVLWVITAKVSKKGNITSAQNTTKVRAGGSVKLEKGTGYALATSGESFVELIITEDANYEENWNVVEEGVRNIDGHLLVLQSRTSEEIAEQSKSLRRRPRSQNKAMAQAQEKKRQQKAQSLGVNPDSDRSVGPSGDNANSIASMGMNPKPTFGG